MNEYEIIGPLVDGLGGRYESPRTHSRHRTLAAALRAFRPRSREKSQVNDAHLYLLRRIADGAEFVGDEYRPVHSMKERDWYLPMPKLPSIGP